jgi:hypothetical protein
MSDKRAADLERRKAVREAVYERDGGCLLREETDLGRQARELGWLPCFGDLTPHHLHKASAMGPYTEENIVALCAHHNHYVELHHTEAQILGLEVRA